MMNIIVIRDFFSNHFYDFQGYQYFFSLILIYIFFIMQHHSKYQDEINFEIILNKKNYYSIFS